MIHKYIYHIARVVPHEPGNDVPIVRARARVKTVITAVVTARPVNHYVHTRANVQ